MPLSTKKTFQAENLSPVRLDKFLVEQFPEKTRQYFQKIIEEGHVKVNKKISKSSRPIKNGDSLEINFPAPQELKLVAQNIPLDVVFENKNVVVINKPAGLVVHPPNKYVLENSLVNALLYHCKKDLSGINGVMRPGIVHRLDKDTSGLMVVAKNDLAHQALMKQFKERTVSKTYYALIIGHLVPAKGTIDSPIGHDPRDRKKMAVSSEKDGKKAITHYQVLKYFSEGYSLLKIKLVTGRTHQIRVHFSAIGYPLVGDVLYGKNKTNHFFLEEYDLKRTFLHAGELAFMLPGSSQTKKFEVPLPEDLQTVLENLKEIVQDKIS